MTLFFRSSGIWEQIKYIKRNNSAFLKGGSEDLKSVISPFLVVGRDHIAVSLLKKKS